MPENDTGVNDTTASEIDGPSLDIVFVYATFPDLACAEAIAGEIVAAGLAACANLTPGMRSIYRWEGNIERGEEVAALFKTRRSLARRLIAWLRVAHPYVNPAAVVLPVEAGSEPFLGWIAAETERATGAR